MFGTILLAVDGSPYAERAAELTQRLTADGDEVVVLHVTEIMPIHGGRLGGRKPGRGGHRGRPPPRPGP
jgi:hypothetical protein